MKKKVEESSKQSAVNSRQPTNLERFLSEVRTEIFPPLPACRTAKANAQADRCRDLLDPGKVIISATV